MKYISSISLICASIAFAGGSQGGGTPPSLEDAGLLLMSSPVLDGVLFQAGGDVGLLTLKALQPEITVSGGSPPASIDGGSLGGGTPPLLKISDSDIRVLLDRKKPIDVIGIKGQDLSFDIQAGNTLDSVILKDRRLIMREAVKAP